MSYQTLHTDDYIDFPEVCKLARRPCDIDDCDYEKEGPGRVSYAFIVCQLSFRLQDCSESHDNSTREPNAVVPLGMDKPFSVYGDE